MRSLGELYAAILSLALAAGPVAAGDASSESAGVRDGLVLLGSNQGASVSLPAPQTQTGLVLAHRRTSSRHGQPQSYLTLKGGGLRVGEDPSTEGLFLGFEVGGTLEQVLEIGFSVDYFYRSSETVNVLSEGSLGNLPVQVVQADRTAAHLVPLGLTLRLRLPLGNLLTPFASTTLAYEMLYLENTSAQLDDPYLDLLLYEETFAGFGVQTAAGLGLQLSPSVGLVAEAGYHWGSPAQRFLVQGYPVDLEVNMDGPFLRGGIRLSL